MCPVYNSLCLQSRSGGLSGGLEAILRSLTACQWEGQRTVTFEGWELLYLEVLMDYRKTINNVSHWLFGHRMDSVLLQYSGWLLVYVLHLKMSNRLHCPLQVL